MLSKILKSAPWLAFMLLVVMSCGSSQTDTKGTESAAETPAVSEAPAETINQYVYFVQPKDGDATTSPVFIEMGVSGMEVEPKGEVSPNKGHHHLVINGDFVEEGTVVPTDETHIHYGGGQTEAQIELKPGEYSLTLQFGDGVHVSYGEKMSATIKVTVQ